MGNEVKELEIVCNDPKEFEIGNKKFWISRPSIADFSFVADILVKDKRKEIVEVCKLIDEKPTRDELMNISIGESEVVGSLTQLSVILELLHRLITKQKKNEEISFEDLQDLIVDTSQLGPIMEFMIESLTGGEKPTEDQKEEELKNVETVSTKT